MPAVASTNPPVLIAHLAAVTERIRVGSGGVMLPNHAPLVVAEQFALLEALHPGRIDLGIGRAPGTDQQTALALRRDPAALSAEDFPQHLLDLLGLLGDERVDGRPGRALRRDPGRPVRPGGRAARAPAASPRSWPARSGCRSPTPTTSARTRRPRRALPGLLPPVAGARAGRTRCHRERAGRRHRRGGAAAGPARPADDAGHPHQPAAAGAEPGRGGGRPASGPPPRRCRATRSSATPDARSRSCAGSPRDTGADEVMVTSTTHGAAERVRSLELLAAAGA